MYNYLNFSEIINLFEDEPSEYNGLQKYPIIRPRKMLYENISIKHEIRKHKKFYETYIKLKNDKRYHDGILNQSSIIDYFTEGSQKVVFTTLNSEKLVKIRKRENPDNDEKEVLIQETLKKIDFFDCIPHRKIIDNYEIVDKVISLHTLRMQRRIDIVSNKSVFFYKKRKEHEILRFCLKKYQDQNRVNAILDSWRGIAPSLEYSRFNYRNCFLNCIQDNSLQNFGVLNNKVVIIDLDTLRHDFLLKHHKRIKKDWNALTNLKDDQMYMGKIRIF